MKFERSVWVLLVCGIALRCLALNQPLLDAHLLRQCQTAAVTRSLIEQPGFQLSSKIPWLGDIDANYILELPVYNYLVMGVNFFTGHLDLSGKLTSIFLWSASFICLQFVWRRFLSSKQAFWANLLFAIAPLNVFYAQAFMPEMLVQLIAFGFVLQLLRYDEEPAITRWVILAGVGLLGLLVKLPEIAHLYLILAFLILRREGWKTLVRPRYLVAAAITIMAMKGWSRYMDSINASHVPEWTSRQNMHDFIGSLGSRFQPQPWSMIFLYVAVFIVPGPSLLVTVYGFFVFLRKERRLILNLWLSALGVFYLLWFGRGATTQSYYNLPILAPLCALFGMGMREFLAGPWFQSWNRIATIGALILVALPAIPVCNYLFKQDEHILNTTSWARTNTKADDLILFRLNHRPDMTNYPYNPAPAYYSGRHVFVWTTALSTGLEARDALTNARYAVVTLPQSSGSTPLALVNRFRRAALPRPESTQWLEQAGFRSIVKESGFEVFRRD